MASRSSRIFITTVVAWAWVACHDEAIHTEEPFARAASVLEDRCALPGCHGATPADHHLLESSDTLWFALDHTGRLDDLDDAHHRARRFINTAEAPEFSTLLRKPLVRVQGGLPHGGGDLFQSPDDPGFDALRRWILTESDGGEDPGGLSDDQEFFGEVVQPHLMDRGCAVSACHGASASNGLILDPGIPDPDGGRRFSQAMIAQNYEAARPFLATDGDPTRSRLLVKALPLSQGGITHRGGNDAFFPSLDDAGVQALLAWAGESGPVEGFVYVKGTPREASHFELHSYQPGSHLYLRAPAGPDGEDLRLTGDLHDGDGDLRDPAVSPDARTVAFALRRADEDGHSLYELDLETLEARRLTDDEGTDLMPTYGPDGALYFVSDRAGRHTTHPQTLNLFRLTPPFETASPVQITFGVGPQLNPRRFAVGNKEGRILVAHRRTLGDRDETLGFSFPTSLSDDYHIYFGHTAPADHLVVFEELPDGRALTIAADPNNRWEGGRLALIDRALGPDLGPYATHAAGLPAFAPTFRVLDDAARQSGVSVGGIYRDPVALPDGTILVAWAPGPFDLSGATPPRFRLLHLTLSEAPAGCSGLSCTPVISRAREWVRPDDGLSAHSPQPLVRRSLREATSGDPTTGDDPILRVADAAVAFELLQNPFAAGPKRFRDDLRYLRIVTADPPGIYAEVPLTDDASAAVRIPANTPLRLQLLDEDRMAVDEQHNRWLFAWPSMTFRDSTHRADYEPLCGDCHGARSGRPEDLIGASPRPPRATRTTELAATEPGPGFPLHLTYHDDIAPLLHRACGACHGDYASGALELVDHTYTRARSSPLIHLVQGHTSHPPVDLPDGALLKLIRWIESGAPEGTP